MIKLTDLLKEAMSKPKAIIMAGGASVGKSTVINSISSLIKGFENLNADKYVEDKNSPMYNNLSAASSQIRKKDLPNAINNKKNLVYDTTASNLGTLQSILNELKNGGYDVMMVMVYAHPIISFLRNYKRERKVPAVGIIGTWVKVYSLLEDYKNIFGDNFIVVNSPASSPEEYKEIENFKKAYTSGKLQEYFNNLLSSGEFVSTFKKSNVGLSPEELAKKEKQKEITRKTLEKNIDKLASIYGDIESKLSPIDLKELPNIVKKFVKQ